MHLKSKSYPALLQGMHEAVMLYWRDDNRNCRPLHRVPNQLQLTLFAVSKSLDKDRLISWPRVCNTFCTLPPEPDFPYPSFLSQVRWIGDKKSSVFYICGQYIPQSASLLRIFGSFPATRHMYQQAFNYDSTFYKRYVKFTSTPKHSVKTMTSDYTNGVPLVNRYRQLCTKDHHKTISKNFIITKEGPPYSSSHKFSFKTTSPIHLNQR